MIGNYMLSMVKDLIFPFYPKGKLHFLLYPVIVVTIISMNTISKTNLSV